jgi:DNA-binding transcriptional MerR regulator
MTENIALINKNKKYFQIKEVSEICKIKSHTLRFWEKEFSQIRPTTRKGSRRYYTKKDIDLLLLVKDLLQNKGLTIAGARTFLNDKKSSKDSNINRRIILELKEVLQILQS